MNLVTLSNFLYKESRERLVASANKYGVCAVHSFDIEDIKQYSFYVENKDIFDGPRGMGYWLWKPLIIAETLRSMADGDILVYMDSGIEIINSIQPLVDICETTNPILLFGNAADININWTKRDCFVLMGCDEEIFWYGPHCDASVSLFKKCSQAVEFVQEWLTYGSDPRIITDLPNECGLPNLAGFQDHRHDQSILSLLAQKHKISLHRIPSQFGNHYKMYDFRVKKEFNCTNQSDQRQVSYYSAVPYYNSFYGQLLNHHRTKAIVGEQYTANTTSQSFLSRIRRYLGRVYRKCIGLLY